MRISHAPHRAPGHFVQPPVRMFGGLRGRRDKSMGMGFRPQRMHGLGQDPTVDSLNSASDTLSSVGDALNNVGVDPSITSAVYSLSDTLSNVGYQIDQANSAPIGPMEQITTTASPVGTNWLLWGGLAAGGLLLYAMSKKKH